jgi:Na+/phosphate symporter
MEGDHYMKTLYEEVRHEMHEIGTALEHCMVLLQRAFIKNSLDPLNACREKLAAIRDAEPELVKKVKELAQKDETKKEYAVILQHLIRICDDLAELTEPLEKKIKDKILFSDRAVTEISFLSQNLTELLKATGDLILVKNPILLRYVVESETMVTKMAIDYATKHEERMIEGLCLPVASPLFLKMLEIFKGIARNAKALASDLSQ